MMFFISLYSLNIWMCHWFIISHIKSLHVILIFYSSWFINIYCTFKFLHFFKKYITQSL